MGIDVAVVEDFILGDEKVNVIQLSPEGYVSSTQKGVSFAGFRYSACILRGEGFSPAEVCERVGKSVISVCKRT